MRNRDYGKLYETYLNRRAILESKGKIMDDVRTINEFIVDYEAMTQTYRDAGYSSPTKNVIQNMANKEIAWDFSLKQARGIQHYFRENFNEKLYIRDIRTARSSFNKEQFDEIVRITYEDLKKEHPEWWKNKETWKAKKFITDTFYGGYNKSSVKY